MKQDLNPWLCVHQKIVTSSLVSESVPTRQGFSRCSRCKKCLSSSLRLPEGWVSADLVAISHFSSRSTSIGYKGCLEIFFELNEPWAREAEMFKWCYEISQKRDFAERKFTERKFAEVSIFHKKRKYTEVIKSTKLCRIAEVYIFAAHGPHLPSWAWKRTREQKNTRRQEKCQRELIGVIFTLCLLN